MADFLEEAAGLLDLIHDSLIVLESRASDANLRDAQRERLNEMFRAVHSLKGLAAMFGLESTHALAHQFETVLADVRDGALQLSSDVVEWLFRAADRLLELLENVSDQRSEPACRDVIDAAQRLLLERGQPCANGRGEPSEAVAAPEATRGASGGTVRMPLERLDELLRLARRLADACQPLNALYQSDRASLLGATLRRVSQDIENVSAQLAHFVSTARQVTLGPVLRRMRRVVREVARQSGKRIVLSVVGEREQLDKRLVDQLAHVLIQLVQNAADHGIEPAAERKERGKPAVGTIRIAVIRVGDTVAIEVSDDGRGLNIERIAERACAQGLLSASQAQSLSHEQVLQLISEPGLSTAQQVTTVSGRGMGMNIVRAKVEELGGSFAVDSSAGRGTTFRLVFAAG